VAKFKTVADEVPDKVLNVLTYWL